MKTQFYFEPLLFRFSARPGILFRFSAQAPLLFRFFASANILNLGPGSAGLPASVII